MTQLMQLDDRAKRLETVFRGNFNAMVKQAPRTAADPARLIRIAYNSVAYNPDLLDVASTTAGMASIIGGVMEAVKLGLTIGGPAQESWLLPFREKGVPKAQLIIGYQGYRNILDRSKSVLDLHPRAVYAKDEFDVNYGIEPRIHHRPWFMLGETEPGPLVAVYAVAHLARGGKQIEVMPKAEIDAHRARSRAAQSGPWVTDYDAMALKTVVRKICKYLPKPSEILTRALDLDDRADRGVPQDFDLAAFVFEDSTVGAVQTQSKQLGALKKQLEEKQAQTVAAHAEAEAKAQAETLPDLQTVQDQAAAQAPPAKVETVQDRPPSRPFFAPREMLEATVVAGESAEVTQEQWDEIVDAHQQDRELMEAMPTLSPAELAATAKEAAVSATTARGPLAAGLFGPEGVRPQHDGVGGSRRRRR